MAQEAFLKAFRAIHSFRGDSAFSTWLYRIAVNTCLSYRSTRRPEHETLDYSLADSSPPAVENVEREERALLVRSAVSRLPDKQRATLILRVYQDLSHREIALALGTTVGAVKANFFHALGNLKKLLAEDARGTS